MSGRAGGSDVCRAKRATEARFEWIGMTLNNDNLFGHVAVPQQLITAG
jgi:hypothetical protein